MANIDQEFVEFVVKSLVSEPDKVNITRSIDEKGVLLELTVAPDDLGRVIGKRGNTAQSIRTLLRALGTKNDARYNLKIVDPEGDSRPRRDNRQDFAAAAPVSTDDSGSSVASSQDDSTSTSAPQSDGASQWAHLSSTSDSDDEDVAEETEKTDEKQEKSVVEKTREELADLDDLDI